MEVWVHAFAILIFNKKGLSNERPFLLMNIKLIAI